MNWCYLLVFNDRASSHDCMREFLDREPDVINWYTFMPNTFLVVTALVAKGLQELIKTHTHGRGFYFVTDINTDHSGWLPRDAWEFIKRYSPKV